MKLLILHNDFDDSLLYMNGEAYQDIDETWTECLVWLKDAIGLNVELRYFDGHRSDFPNKIDKEGSSMNFDEKLNVLIEKWKEQTARQIRCQNEGTDHDLCPICNEQLYFCDCADRMAQNILELQYGFNDFEEE